MGIGDHRGESPSAIDLITIERTLEVRDTGHGLQ
jgi:hypothetical protein